MKNNYTQEKKKPETAEDYRSLLLSFLGSLTLCDHMGDVSNDMLDVLEHLGIEPPEEWEELGRTLGLMGVRTLQDTPLISDDDLDDEEE
jgi:hypothetical protein